MNDSRPTAASLPPDCDVLVVGGGINGAGIARDLAGRGLSVVLVERDDLAAHTSSASTKLIHGGLRYLEHGEFALVRKALQEREVLLRSAPHLMRPLRFILPHDPGAGWLRPAWAIRLGLFLYDHLARRELLPGSEGVDLRRHPAGAPLQQHFTRGFAYSDGWVDDARLVVLNALGAQAAGAQILPHTECVEARCAVDHWQIRLRSTDGAATSLRARALVNAAGPWAENFLRNVARDARGDPLASRSLRLVKGSHIVVPRCFAHADAYLFQNPDRRIVFAIPYEGEFTLIGTTDVELHGDPGAARVDDDETAYLCAQASRYFRVPVTPADVRWRFCGVRPLLADDAQDPAAVTRDYRLELDRDGPPLLTVWGGKLTTFRRLAEEAADLLAPALGAARGPWTAEAVLPGGDLSDWTGRPPRSRQPQRDFDDFVRALAVRHPWLPDEVRVRWAHAYGSRISLLLGSASSVADLGERLAPGVFTAELDYLHAQEWARDGDDMLWRRSKLGLHLDGPGRARVAAWFRRRRG